MFKGRMRLQLTVFFSICANQVYRSFEVVTLVSPTAQGDLLLKISISGSSVLITVSQGKALRYKYCHIDILTHP